MENIQQPTTAASSAPSSRGLFGSKIPASAAFLIGAVLFFLPFVDIKCNDVPLGQVSGFELATGFEFKGTQKNSLFQDNSMDQVDKKTKRDPNKFAMAALGLGVLGFIISLLSFNGRSLLAGLIGLLSAGALVALMFDVKSKIKTDIPANTGNADQMNLNMGDTMKITADFTPWFYVALVAFVVAAFFSWSQRRSK
jgi:hypothetical protein